MKINSLKELGTLIRLRRKSEHLTIETLSALVPCSSRFGPGFSECALLLRKHCSVPAPHLLRMLDWAVFNLCIGNMDAHAKNLSILMVNSKKVLAPFYDLICTLYYDGFSTELAMSIGGRYNPDKIRAAQWKKFALDTGLPEKVVMQAVPKIARRIIDALPATEDEVAGIVPQKAFIHDLRMFILNRCMHLLRNLN